MSVRDGDQLGKEVSTEFVSGNYFQTLGIGAFTGRVLSSQDDSPAAAPTAVISYASWQADFGRDPKSGRQDFQLPGTSRYRCGHRADRLLRGPCWIFPWNQRTRPAHLAQQKQASLQSETDKSLYDLGVISGLSYSASKGKADELGQRNQIEQQRYGLNQKAISTQMAVQRTKVQQAEAVLSLRQKDAAALSVRAGIAGVLVNLPHQVGEHVNVGATLAEVIQPDELKASLKIPETQGRDIQIGQPAEIDTHNGVIPGKVSRIDPSVQNGTVTVDVQLSGALPQGARPDLSVDGTIDLDRLQNVLYMDRPAVGNENSTLSLFKVAPDGKSAARTAVQVGPASVNSMEVLSGLNVGDTIILSDMSRWDSANSARLPH